MKRRFCRFFQKNVDFMSIKMLILSTMSKMSIFPRIYTQYIDNMGRIMNEELFFLSKKSSESSFV